MEKKSTATHTAVTGGNPGLNGIDQVTANMTGIDVGILYESQPDSIQVVLGVFSGSLPMHPYKLSSAWKKPVVIDQILLLLWETATQSVMLLSALPRLRKRGGNEVRIRRGKRAVRQVELRSVGRETAL